MVTEYPRACNSLASDADIIPFPRDEVTPPVTNIYLTAVVDFCSNLINNELVR